MSPKQVNLGLCDVKVQCVEVGETILRPGQCDICNYLHVVSQHHPFVISVHIAENDLGRMSDSHTTGITAWCLLSPLSRSGAVIVRHLISFPRLGIAIRLLSYQ